MYKYAPSLIHPAFLAGRIGGVVFDVRGAAPGPWPALKGVRFVSFLGLIRAGDMPCVMRRKYGLHARPDHAGNFEEGSNPVELSFPSICFTFPRSAS
jgi:hypothetical protein